VGVVKKTSLFEKPGVGMIGIVLVRLPFAFFTRKPVKAFFRPDFPNAGWYNINLDLVDLFDFLESNNNSMTAMSYLRDKDKDLQSRMVHFNSP